MIPIISDMYHIADFSPKQILGLSRHSQELPGAYYFNRGH